MENIMIALVVIIIIIPLILSSNLYEGYAELSVKLNGPPPVDATEPVDDTIMADDDTGVDVTLLLSVIFSSSPVLLIVDDGHTSLVHEKVPPIIHVHILHASTSYVEFIAYATLLLSRHCEMGYKVVRGASVVVVANSHDIDG
jgi:hypothetical protein